MSWFGAKTQKATESPVPIFDGMVDLHSHVLPGVDDGPATVGQSRELLSGMRRIGYGDVAATPHFRIESREPNLQLQRDLIRLIETDRSLSYPRVHPGAEIVFGAQFVDEVVKGQLPSLGLAGAYLVEFGFIPGSIPVRTEEIVFRLRAKGVRLVLAHPERSADLLEHPERLTALRQSGMLAQLDLMSLSGKHGRRVRDFAWSLVHERQIDLVSSDIHDARQLGILESSLGLLRDSLRDSLRDELRDEFQGEFERLVSTNPRAILQGKFDQLLLVD